MLYDRLPNLDGIIYESHQVAGLFIGRVGVRALGELSVELSAADRYKSTRRPGARCCDATLVKVNTNSLRKRSEMRMSMCRLLLVMTAHFVAFPSIARAQRGRDRQHQAPRFSSQERETMPPVKAPRRVVLAASTK